MLTEIDQVGLFATNSIDVFPGVRIKASRYTGPGIEETTRLVFGGKYNETVINIDLPELHKLIAVLIDVREEIVEEYRQLEEIESDSNWTAVKKGN